MAAETSVSFVADGLRVEGRLAIPSGATRAAVLCHPHPQYGGAMDNNVVVAVARALAASGVAVLRFNFRGVGASQGTYSGSMAETAEARAAVECLRKDTGLPEVVLIGYSFGAVVASLVAVDAEGIDRLVAIALPASMVDVTVVAGCLKPKLFVHGDRDEFCPSGVIEDLVARSRGSARLRVLSGADHFLFGYEDEVAGEVCRFVLGEGASE